MLKDTLYYDKYSLLTKYLYQYKPVLEGIYMIYLSLNCKCQLHYWASSRASYHLQGKYRLPDLYWAYCINFTWSGLRTVNYKNTILTFGKLVIDIYQDYYQVLIIVCIFRRMGWIIQEWYLPVWSIWWSLALLWIHGTCSGISCSRTCTKW